MLNAKKYSSLLLALGNKIRLLRLTRGMTQTALSLKCDMEKSSVSKIEAGQVNVSIVTLFRLSEGLETGIKDLF